MTIRLTCEFCGREFFDEATEAEIAMWEEGKAHVQDCFPRMRPEHREMLISGMCPICWDKAFPEDEEEDILACEMESLGERWW